MVRRIWKNRTDYSLTIEYTDAQIFWMRFWARIVKIFTETKVEHSERLNMLLHFGWAASIWWNVEFMRMSPFTSPVAGHIPPLWLGMICWTLLLWHMIGILFGGAPTYFEEGTNPKAAIVWFRVRQIPLWASMILWWTMASLFRETGLLVPGIITYGGFGIDCGIGIWQLQKKIKTLQTHTLVCKSRQLTLRAEGDKVLQLWHAENNM